MRDGEGKKRARVTLKWKSAPLKLPGEEDREPKRSLSESGELRLPDAADLPEPPSSVNSPPEERSGLDGWERQRSRPTPPPQRYVTPSGAGTIDDGGALSLVDNRSRPSSPTVDVSAEMDDRFELGDYTAALRLAELILGRDADHVAAQETARACRDKLALLYGSRLGSLSRRPHPAVEGARVRWLGLDHRAGFLLAQVDGAHSIEELVDVTGWSRLEVLKTLVELLEVGAIRFVD